MSALFAFVMPGGAEWMIIFVVLLLLFGAKKLPELARGIGRSLGEFKKAKDEFEHEIRYTEKETEKEDYRRIEAERRRKFEESKRREEPASKTDDASVLKSGVAESGDGKD